MKALNYCVLDVFTNKSYKGNPLAVVFTDGNLELKEYENIAREFGYSETSFIYYSEDRKALNIRSFTPTGFEVDGAGHNLLGAVCAALLKKMDVFQEQEANPFVIMKESSISLFVSFDNTDQLPLIKMLQKPAVIKKSIASEIIANALGITNNDLGRDFDPTIVQTEVAHLMIPIKNLEALYKIKPDNEILIDISKKTPIRGLLLFCFHASKRRKYC